MTTVISWIDWEKLTTLGCPFMRHLKVFGKLPYKERDTIRKFFHYERSGVWVAQNEDPCPKKECGFTGCHNYGMPHKGYNPFVILVDKK